MNKAELIDKEIADLEKKLGTKKRSDKKTLKKELQDENMFELFTCVDHILGKDDLEGDEEDGEAEDGEEEYLGGGDDGDEEDLEELSGDKGDKIPRKEANEKKAKQKEDINLLKQPLGEKLGKRLPEVERLSEQKTKSEHGELIGMLVSRWKENKDLLTKVNKLYVIAAKHRISGKGWAQITSEALKATPASIPKPQAGKDKKPQDKKDKDASKSKERRFRKSDEAKEFAGVKDRLKVSLFVVSMMNEKFVADFIGALNDSKDIKLWVVAGLFSLGTISAQFILEWLAENATSGSKDEMEKIVHMIAREVRKKEPARFKELGEFLRKTFPTGETRVRLDDHLEKLRNNMEIPGSTHFEISNTIAKQIEKLQKKKKPQSIQKLNSLSSVIQSTTSDLNQPIPELPLSQTATPKPISQQKYEVATDDVLKNDSQLLKLASKLNLVTQIERKVLKIMTKGGDYIDSVQSLINLKTHGGENKEIASTILECCMNEKNYNKYYFAVAHKLIGLKPEFAYSFQISIWDCVKEMESYESSTIQNLSSLVAGLVSSGDLDSKLFKFMDDSPLPLTTAQFFRRILKMLVQQMEREKLRDLCKKLCITEDVRKNCKRIILFMKDKKDFADEEYASKIVSWFEFKHAIPEPQARRDRDE